MKTAFGLVTFLSLVSVTVADLSSLAELSDGARALKKAKGKKGKKGEKSKSSKRGKPERPEPTDSILEIANATDFLSVLTALVTGSEAASAALSGEGPFTVFAPTDDAFAAFLAENPEPDVDDVLFYHVIPNEELELRDLFTGIQISANGEPLPIKRRNTRRKLVDRISILPDSQDVRLVAGDIFATNGVVHVIDQVLVPPTNTIADLAIATDDLSILVDVLVLTGLVDLVADESAGPFTVFAPLNSAFEALGSDTITALTTEDGLGTLTDILLYHVVVGKVLGKGDLRFAQDIETALGEDVEVRRQGKELNDSRRFVVYDILANNGVVHIIDEVLIPPSR